MWGADLKYIETKFGNEYLIHCIKDVEKYVLSKDVLMYENKLFLTDKGKLLADKIASDLFEIEKSYS